MEYEIKLDFLDHVAFYVTRNPEDHQVELTTIKVDANKFYSGQ